MALDDSPLCASIGGDLWLTPDRTDRMRAAALCRACPVLADCFAEAEYLRTRPPEVQDEPWRPYGVWGGHAYDGKGNTPTRIRPLSRPRRSAAA